jgi:hypothetical protein
VLPVCQDEFLIILMRILFLIKLRLEALISLQFLRFFLCGITRSFKRLVAFIVSGSGYNRSASKGEKRSTQLLKNLALGE